MSRRHRATAALVTVVHVAPLIVPFSPLLV